MTDKQATVFFVVLGVVTLVYLITGSAKTVFEHVMLFILAMMCLILAIRNLIRDIKKEVDGE